VELARAYRRCAADSEAQNKETDGVSHEANRYLGDVPEWYSMDIRRVSVILIGVAR